MKEIKINRFLRRKPESISFSGSPIPDPISFSVPQKQNIELTNVRSEERTSEHQEPSDQYMVVIPDVRKKIRHSFDIYEDQKIALDKLQLALMSDLKGKKPSLGEIIQQAIDYFIKHKAKNIQGFKIIKSTNESPDEDTNVRSDK